MTPGYFIYNTVASLAAPIVVGMAAAKGRLRGHWRERLGLMPPLESESGGRRVWIHAASVGEAQVAAALLPALRRLDPALTAWVSTTTDTGLATARSLLPADVPVLTFPFDVYGGPGRALDRLKPDMVIILETELWPNFLRAAKRRGLCTMLANGRLSPRSIKGYHRARFLFKEVLSFLDLMVMIRPEDRDRIISLGAAPDRVQVAANAKFDLLLARTDQERVDELGRQLGLTPGRPVLVAGSTREGEEKIILDVFLRLRKDFPDLHLILAPRHVSRADEVQALIQARGLGWGRRSGGRCASAPDVTLVDVMGELFYLYGLAAVAFCGGSLVNLGGQNPLEPAAWGKPVLYGPSMEDFLDARSILEESGAGLTAEDQEELHRLTKELLAGKAEAERRGRAGLKALTLHQGAADRQAALAMYLLGALDKNRAT